MHVVGAPGNRPGAVLFGHVADPRRAARIQYGGLEFDNAIVLGMDVAPGHSGRPVFDGFGQLIGMVAGFGLGDPHCVPYVPSGIAYAVPAATIARYFDEIAPRPRVAIRR